MGKDKFVWQPGDLEEIPLVKRETVFYMPTPDPQAQHGRLNHGYSLGAARTILKVGLPIEKVRPSPKPAIYLSKRKAKAQASSWGDLWNKYILVIVDQQAIGQDGEDQGDVIVYAHDIQPEAILQTEVYQSLGPHSSPSMHQPLDIVVARVPPDGTVVLYAVCLPEEFGDFQILPLATDGSPEQVTTERSYPAPHYGRPGEVGGSSPRDEGPQEAPSGAEPKLEYHGATKDSPKVRSMARSTYESAVKAEPAVTSLVQAAAQAAGGTAQGLDFRLKREGSIADKIVRDAIEKDIPIEQAAADMTDVNRYTIVLSGKGFVDGVKAAGQALVDQGYEKYDDKWRNFMAPPASQSDYNAVYHGYNTVWVNPDSGQRFELQFHTPETWNAKMQAHVAYEKWRTTPSDSPERSKLWSDMTDLYKGYTPPDAFQSLPGDCVGCSTGVVPRSGPHTKADPEVQALARDRYLRAVTQEPRLTTLMAQIANRTGAQLEGLQFRVKAFDCVADKIIRDSEEKGISIGKAAKHIADANRYAFIFLDNRYTDGVQETVDILKGLGFEARTKRWKNWLAEAPNPSDRNASYHGLNTVWRDPTTLEPFEIQFHTPTSWEAALVAHIPYQRWRLLPDDDPRKYEYWSEMAGAQAGYVAPEGFDQLKGQKIGPTE